MHIWEVPCPSTNPKGQGLSNRSRVQTTQPVTPAPIPTPHLLAFVLCERQDRQNLTCVQAEWGSGDRDENPVFAPCSCLRTTVTFLLDERGLGETFFRQ